MSQAGSEYSGGSGSDYSYSSEDEAEKVEPKEKYQPRAEDVREVLSEEVPVLTEHAIVYPARVETFGKWMNRKSGKFKSGKENSKDITCEGLVSLMELNDVFKLSFQHFLAPPSSPQLSLWLSPIRAKRGMGDVEDNCTKIHLDSDGGAIGGQSTSGDFEQLVAIEEPMQFHGVYVIKEALVEPATSECVIYGYANLENYAVQLPMTEEVMGIHEAADKIEQLKTRVKAIKGIPPTAEDLTLKTVKRHAARAWRHFKKNQKHDIDFQDFKDMLDYLDIVVLEPRALKLFGECDMDNSGAIQISEFEIALLMNARLPPETNLHPIDAFTTFDLDKSGLIDRGEFMEACAVMGIDTADAEKVDKLFHRADLDKNGGVDLEEFKSIWVQLLDDPGIELEKRDVAPLTGWGAKRKNQKKLLKLLTMEENARDDAYRRVKLDAMEEKRLARLRKDERRKLREAQADMETHKAAREQAKRDRRERLRKRKEATELLKRQEREKKLRAQMAEAKKKREDKVKADFKAARQKKELDRKEARRVKGEDHVHVTEAGLREIPLYVYQGKGAAQKMSDYVSLDFSRNKISKIPKAQFFFWLASIRRLDLSHNRLEVMPGDELDSLGTLEILRLNNNRLREMPESFGKMHSLRRVDLSHNNLESLPTTIGNLTKVQVFNLNSNKLVSLPPQIGDMESLQTLDLAMNQLFEMPDEMAMLTDIRRVDISWNKMVELPVEIGAMNKMTIFDATGNQIATLPKSFRDLCELHTLHLSQNAIKKIDDSISGLTSLKELDFSYNNIAQMSSKIRNCLQLNWLNLRHNDLEVIPEDFGLLSELKNLDIRENKLAAIIPEFGGLNAMFNLDASYNKIAGSIPEEFGLAFMLLTIDFSHNDIEDIPNNIGALVQLESLNLSFNKLTTLPETFENLTNIISLNLSTNRITSLPYSIGQMACLETLNLSSNRLAYVPEAVCELESLTSLDLYNNTLKCLPHQFSELLPQLRECHLSRNTLVDMPPKWCGNWSLKQQYQQLWSGYTDGEAVDFALEQGHFYPAASREWEATGKEHTEGKLLLQDFIAGVRERMGNGWEERYVDLITPFYFECTQHGLIPIYHQVPEDMVAIRAEQVEKSKAMRQLKMERVREIDKGENDRLQDIYFGDLPSKVTRAEQKIVRGNARKEKIHTSQVDHLRAMIAVRHQAQEERMQRREKARKDHEELTVRRLCRTVNDRNSQLIIQRQREMRDALRSKVE